MLLNYSRLLICIHFILFIILITGSKVNKLDIPGCPDLASLPGDLNDLDSEQLSTLKCFCSLISDDTDNLNLININCIFGSRLEDLADVLMAVDDANKTVNRISLDHIEILPTEDSLTLEEILSADCIQTLKELEIKDCRGQLIERRDNPIVEFSPFPILETITIENCELENIPGYLLSKTKRLKSLLLSENQIIQLYRNDLEPVADTLELLDLTSNLITHVEDKSISQLKNLKTLFIGEHNYANKTLLYQIGQLNKLEILDMTRMDGLDSLSEITFNENDNNLKQWILTGCNIKSINETDFNGLKNLEELDIKVNLLEAIEENAFSDLINLKSLSLAGNFLREFEFTPTFWNGLENLEVLDLGWNELRTIHSHSFQKLQNLKSLSLRHNEKLNQIEIGAFEGLSELVFLNLSGTSIKDIKKTTFEKLASLQELYLSECQLSSIETGAFDVISNTLQKLFLNNNKLTKLDVSLLETLKKVREIDMSDNPWLCDNDIWTIVNWVKKTYVSAAESSREFFFMNSNTTQCSRPYSLEGVGLLEIKKSDLSTYDESIDTTTARIETTTISENSIENATFINFEDLFHVIGEEGNDTLDIQEDKKKPQYDINTVRFGQKTTSKNPTNSMFATVAVGLLVIMTIIGILLVVRRNKSKKSEIEKSQRPITAAV